MGKTLRKLAEHAEGILLCLFTFLLMADVLLGILGRYVNFEIVFADELGKYLFVWLCMTGVSAAARDSQHVRLSFLVVKFPNLKGTWILSQVLFLIFSLFFFYWSFRLTRMHFVMEKSVMGFRFPMYVFSAALPVGFALTAIRLIQDILHTLKNRGPLNPWRPAE